MRIVYKTYYRNFDCLPAGLFTTADVFGPEVTILVNSFTFNGMLEDDDTYSAAPAWFFHLNAFPSGDTLWVMTPPDEQNVTYRFSWTGNNKDGSETEYIVELVMLDYCNTEIGCDGANLKVLTWLTREGGWARFPFNGKTTFEVKIPDGKTYINTDYVKRYNERPEVYNGELLTTGNIPEASLDLLESLKYAVQVYLIEGYDELHPVYKPVMITDGDFIKRKTGDKLFDVSVRFIYAERKQIQTQ